MDDMLTISMLGGLSIRVGGEPVTGFASRKVEALLVYLACTGRPQLREVVAEILWEERSQSQAMSNLRVVLSSLRKNLGPYITITRDTVALNPDAAVWLDAAEMERALSTGQLEEAFALYHGDFLEGFFVHGSPDFEDWAAIERERLRRLVLDGLRDLIVHDLEAGEYQAGIRHAARLLELDSLEGSRICSGYFRGSGAGFLPAIWRQVWKPALHTWRLRRTGLKSRCWARIRRAQYKCSSDVSPF